ncbi:hypothetical protein [Halobacillus sp. Marseille-Q1614]|uniref:hypothetical protein n=1 Tax=Halobacillus sp. Marseille-Q1614 TaxID=2709134 RepID=UPI001570C1DC|nr:hypothetical protein [Halobacillus sp. Marseille-Q1614]
MGDNSFDDIVKRKKKGNKTTNPGKKPKLKTKSVNEREGIKTEFFSELPDFFKDRTSKDRTSKE